MWPRLRTALSRVSSVWSRQRLDEEARREIDEHLDLLAARYVRQGMSHEEAQSAARRRFGNVTIVREDIHEANGFGLLEHAVRDMQYGFRQLRGSPGFTLVAAATLGLGIGGTSAVFSVVEAVLLKPLPYEEPGELVRFYQQRPGRPDTQGVLAGTHFTFLREHATAFDDVAAAANYSETGVDLAIGDGRVERLRVLRVSSEYFSTLQAHPALGRGFDRDDETGSRRVVLSDRVWRAFHGADASVVGTTIVLSGEPYEVAGIAPRGFEDPVAPDVAAWIPYPLARDTYEENNSLTAIGRLRNGITLEQAQAELTTLEPLLRKRWPAATLSAIVALPLHGEVVEKARGPLHLVFAAVGFLLLLACVNVANLVLVRATGRVREFAVRTALGSSRSRLVRQLLVESLLLASLGGAIGLPLAAAGIDVLRRIGRDAIPRLDEVAIDASVLVFATAVTAATAVAFGIAPALRLTALSPVDALRQQSRTGTAGRGLARLRSALATAQVGLALTLLGGAAVLVASFHQLQQVPLGFQPEGAVTFEVNLPTARYDAERRAWFQEELARRLETIPGVRAAGGISRLPATGSYHPWNTHILTGPLAGTAVDRSRFRMQQRIVSGDVFGALGIPVLAGRTFDDRDDARAPGRAVVSANFARLAFPGVPFDGVLGQRIRAGGREWRIVGVVGDVSLDVYGTPTMTVYRAHRQYADNRNWALTQVAAAALAPEQVFDAVRAEVARLDPQLVVYRPAPMSDVVGRGASRERFALAIVGAFAAVSLLLAALGLYGVLAYMVRERRAEIGVRIALGATAADIRALVLRHAAVVVAVGVPAGLGGALLLGRWLGALAFEISPSDPRILVSAALLLAAVAFVAAWLPAQRAARVPPTTAMQGMS